MVDKKTWEEFQESGMLWWINMILHTMGWSIVYEIDEDNVFKVYPARVKFRGFEERLNTEGYIKVSKYMAKNAKKLIQEAEE